MTAYAYVANSVSGTVSVIDPAAVGGPAVIATVPTGIGSNPSYVAVSSDGTRAYVTLSGTGAVVAIDTASNTISTSYSMTVFPKNLAVTPNGAKVYAVAYPPSTNTVEVINTITGTVNSVTIGANPWAVAITPNGQYAYITTTQGVDVLSTTTDTIVATIPIGTGCSSEGIAITPNGRFAYVANNFFSTVSVIDTSTNSVVTTISSGISSPNSVAITPDGNTVLVTNPTSAKVYVITANAVSRTISLTYNPGCVAIYPDGGNAYVTLSPNASVEVINLSSWLTSTFPVGSDPVGVTFQFMPYGVAQYGALIAATGNTPVNLSISGQFNNVLSLLLTAGDWDVTGVCYPDSIVAASTCYELYLSAYPANATTDYSDGNNYLPISNVPSNPDGGSIPNWRVQVANGQTQMVYLKVRCSWTTTAPAIYARLSARRMQ
jgi:YVTN family beta-propeller protein